MRPPRAPAVAADVRDQLVQRRVRERVVLHLDDRPPAGHARARPRRRASPPRRAACRRSGPRPKRSRSPAVARNTPPARPTSSPSTITSSSRASSVCSASLTASTSVSSAIAHVPRRIDVRVREEQLRIGGRLGLGRGDPGAHQVLRLLARRFDALVREHARRRAAAARSGRRTRSPAPPRRARGRCTRSGRRRSRAARRGSGRTRSASARRRSARARPRRARRRRRRARRARRPSRRGCRSRLALSASDSARVCASSGVEIAHWLLLQTNTAGAFITAARFTPSWNSPSLVAPSPKNAIATAFSPRSFLPHASPAACGTWLAIGTADRRDVPVGGVPPAGRMAAPPLQDRLDRQPAHEPDRRLAIRREDPVVVAERERRAGLDRLVVPEDRVRPDAALPVVDDGALVVGAQEHHAAVQLEQLGVGEPLESNVGAGVRRHAPGG